VDRPQTPALVLWAPVVVAIIAIATLVFFDLQTDLPLLDEYVRQWMLKRIADGHGLTLFGTNPGLVQLAVAAPLALAHLAPRFWRLTEIPFLWLLALYTWRTARRLGADRFWSLVAAVGLLCSPLMLSVATGMMNETIFAGLFAAGIYYLLTWVEDGQGIPGAVLFTFLATLQRPQGAALALGITLGLLVHRWSRGWRRADVVGLVATWILAVAAYKGPDVFRSVPVTGIAAGQSSVLLFAVHALVTLPIMLGLLLLPFVVALLFRDPSEARFAGRREMAPVAIAFFGLLGSVKFVLLGSMILPGPFIGYWGLGQPTVPETTTDVKRALFPGLLFIALQVLVTLGYLVLLVWRRRLWNWRLLGAGYLMVVVAATQFLPLLGYGASSDRFFLAVSLPLFPLLAVVASKAASQGPARAWALAVLAISVAVYAAGEQDYIAWQVARDRTAQLAYQQYAPSDVEAGFEENEVHVQLPSTDSGGRLPAEVSKRPKVLVVFASPGDPRPGYEYRSLVPGKIVLQRTGY
jgi:hypothetical protein